MTDVRTPIDVNDLRDPDIALYRLRGVDDAYVFYYDETNNDRRLHVTEKGLNVANPGCFVLGGIAFRGAAPPIFDMAALRQAIRLQSSADELKLKHLGKGEFLELMAQPRVGVFLEWVVGQPDFFLHYIALEPLYWATVDIIDSIIMNEKATHLFTISPQLKDDLFTILSSDIRDMADLFRRFSYPNVGDRRAEFMEKVRYRLERRRSKLPDMSYKMLKGVLDIGCKTTALPFLQDEEPNTLIDSLQPLFINRICLFKNAKHIFDVEETIRERIEKFAFYDGEKRLNHFSFADSKAEPGVQISDVLVGLLGKMITYTSRSDPPQIQTAVKALSPQQRHAIRQLKILIDRSDDVTPAMFNNVISNRANAMSGFILDA
jgi:hypothetical protein